MKLLSIALFAIISNSAFAANRTAPAPAAHAAPAPVARASSSAQFGMAGCGLGSLVFKENTKTQILAATTNGTFGSQTFGITFGTSNCEENAKLASKEQIQQYIAINQNALKNDIARGNGESLNGLAEIMGAKDTNAFASQMKANYSKIFAQSNLSAQQITENLYSVLN